MELTEYQLPENPQFGEVIQRVAIGAEVRDEEFDALFPEPVRRHSLIHWTPVDVARRAAELLAEKPSTRVLDVGSGVGKFCVVGALTTRGFFTGIEHRAHLVKLASELVRRYRIPRVRFECGNMNAIEWDGYDAFYLYNPFCENLHRLRRVDGTVPLGRNAYRQYVRFTEARLVRAPIGTRVVTYHGFGGDMPPSYRCEVNELKGSGRIELWVKCFRD